ncbi:MAG: Crp/Fnr family transcriptional regulator [Polyangiales bacterium]
MLRTHPVFSTLGAEARAALARVTPVARVRKGESLWRQGERANVFLLVTGGLVGVSVAGGARREVLLGLAGPGDAVGEASSLLGEPRRDHAFAFSAATAVARVPRDAVTALCEGEGALAMAYARQFAARQRAADRRLASLTQPSETRIAEMVLALVARFGERLDDGTVVVPHRITRANLAAMVGTTIETAIRTLSRWTREGLLAPAEGTLVVNDVTALARIAQVAPEFVPQLAELTRLI